MTDSAKDVDYLDVDMPIPGQNFVCLSFVSPESILIQKESYKLKRFIKFLENDEGNVNINSTIFEEKYADFLASKDEELETEFHNEIGGANSIRGLKVRGVYNTQEEANKRAESLQKMDRKFNVFVGQVGYWLPWNPCADKIEDETFADSQLNDLMTKYKENNVNKDIFYEEQKRDKIKAAQEERLRAEKERKAQEALENVSEEPSTEEPSVEDEPCADEPCVEEVTPEPEQKKISEDEPCSVISEEPAPGGASDLERALTEEDPWMANKNRNA